MIRFYFTLFVPPGAFHGISKGVRIPAPTYLFYQFVVFLIDVYCRRIYLYQFVALIDVYLRRSVSTKPKDETLTSLEIQMRARQGLRGLQGEKIVSARIVSANASFS